MENQEIWKDIKGYEGLYRVSNLGKVKSLSRLSYINHQLKERILRPTLNSNGYPKVGLHNGSMIIHVIHRLVAIHFIANPEKKPCVNHKKGIKIDNRATELEWCTYAENNLHSFRILGRTNKSGKDNPLSKSVSQYSKSGKLIETFGSKREAQKITGIGRQHISDVCLGKRKTAGGFIWGNCEGANKECFSKPC